MVLCPSKDWFLILSVNLLYFLKNNDWKQHLHHYRFVNHSSPWRWSTLKPPVDKRWMRMLTLMRIRLLRRWCRWPWWRRRSADSANSSDTASANRSIRPSRCLTGSAGRYANHKSSTRVRPNEINDKFLRPLCMARPNEINDKFLRPLCRLGQMKLLICG